MTTISRIFYGYVDYTDDGRPFYVGKGTADRVKNLSRNAKHRRVSAKYGCRRRIEYEFADEGVVHEWEMATIAKHRTYDSRSTGIGCNFTKGGEGMTGLVHTPEARERIAAAFRGRKQVNSPEARMKMSASHTGKKLSPEHAAKLKASRTGVSLSAETRAKISAAHVGMKHTPETRAKISAVQTGKKWGPRKAGTGRKISDALKAYYANKRKAKEGVSR